MVWYMWPKKADKKKSIYLNYLSKFILSDRSEDTVSTNEKYFSNVSAFFLSCVTEVEGKA